MDGMMRLPQQRAVVSPRLGGSPPIPTTDTGYPWADGDVLCAADLNAAIATAGAGNIGRNFVHNPLFNVAQRGAGPLTINGYLLDRWQTSTVTDTVSYTQQVLADADRAAIGDEAAAYCLQNNFTGNAAAGAYDSVAQPIENARRLAGKTVTVSFWAAGTISRVGLNILQNTGTGGSPSASVWALSNGASITLSGGWARYSTTIAIPTLAGKTLGTNSNHFHSLAFWFSSGSTNNTIAGNVGVQSGTVYLWGVQLEIGSVATPLEKPDPRYDLSNCQRFYQTGQWGMVGNSVAGGTNTQTMPLSVLMRAIPTFTYDLSGGTVNFTSGSPQAAALHGNAYMASSVVATAAGAFQAIGNFTASADL